jgi:preprotein translocase subunit SecB
VTKEGRFDFHPIQLDSMDVISMSFERLDDESVNKDDLESFNFYHAYNEYDQENKVFGVKIKAEVFSQKDSTEYFKIVVELAGLFTVDETKFNVEHIYSFASQNAPLILYPYLREQVYGISARAGVEMPILPLFVVPTPQQYNK